MEQNQRAKVRVLEEKRVGVDSSEQKEIPFFYGWASKMGIKTEELLRPHLIQRRRCCRQSAHHGARSWTNWSKPVEVSDAAPNEGVRHCLSNCVGSPPAGAVRRKYQLRIQKLQFFDGWDYSWFEFFPC